jgi:RNA-splicing ligase RtcB
VEQEQHYGERVLMTRKGAVRAGAGDLGIIPGSMGARSFIVRGKGNPERHQRLQSRRRPLDVPDGGEEEVLGGGP